MPVLAIKRACTRLHLVRAHLCTNLREIWNISLQDINWSTHIISWRSQLSLRRYLQNNIDFLNTLIFNVFSIFSQFLNLFHFGHILVKFSILQWSWTFFNSQDDELFKNVRIFKICSPFISVATSYDYLFFFLIFLILKHLFYKSWAFLVPVFANLKQMIHVTVNLVVAIIVTT